MSLLICFSLSYLGCPFNTFDTYCGLIPNSFAILTQLNSFSKYNSQIFCLLLSGLITYLLSPNSNQQSYLFENLTFLYSILSYKIFKSFLYILLLTNLFYYIFYIKTIYTIKFFKMFIFLDFHSILYPFY